MGAGVGGAVPTLVPLLLAGKILKHSGAADTTLDWENMDALIVLPWDAFICLDWLMVQVSGKYVKLSGHFSGLEIDSFLCPWFPGVLGYGLE